MRSRARRRRCAKLASSLPRVVGVAACPWVRDSIGSAACRRASSRRAAATRASAGDRESTRLNSSHGYISYAVFCLKKKKKKESDKLDYHTAIGICESVGVA